MADYTFDKYMLFKNDLDRERVEKILQMNCPDLSYFLINAEENTFDVIKLQSGEWIIDKEKKEILCKKEKMQIPVKGDICSAPTVRSVHFKRCGASSL